MNPRLNPQPPENADRLAWILRSKREATITGPRGYRRPMTQEDLAEMLDVSQVTVSRWENGRSRPEVDMLPAVIKALKLDPDEVWEAYRQTATPRHPTPDTMTRLDMIEANIARILKALDLAPLPESLPGSRKR